MELAMGTQTTLNVVGFVALAVIQGNEIRAKRANRTATSTQSPVHSPIPYASHSLFPLSPPERHTLPPPLTRGGRGKQP